MQKNQFLTEITKWADTTPLPLPTSFEKLHELFWDTHYDLENGRSQLPSLPTLAYDDFGKPAGRLVNLFRLHERPPKTLEEGPSAEELVESVTAEFVQGLCAKTLILSWYFDGDQRLLLLRSAKEVITELHSLATSNANHLQLHIKKRKPPMSCAEHSYSMWVLFTALQGRVEQVFRECQKATSKKICEALSRAQAEYEIVRKKQQLDDAHAKYTGQEGTADQNNCGKKTRRSTKKNGQRDTLFVEQWKSGMKFQTIVARWNVANNDSVSEFAARKAVSRYCEDVEECDK